MPIILDALAEFNTALAEVDVLISSAAESLSEERKYAAYNKCAILLLSGKFENFAETIAEEYVYKVNLLRLKSDVIPDILKLQHTFTALSQIDALKNKAKSTHAAKIFTALGDLWSTTKPFDALKMNCSFSYGKHGEEELNRLFSNIGMDDLFNQVLIYQQLDKDDPTTLKQIDFKGVFNSVTGIRNNILHQDATPSLTHIGIIEYKTIFQLFAEKLANYLITNLEALTLMQSFL